MSPTLLELAVTVVLVLVAWRLGLGLAPIVARWLKGAPHELDEAGRAEDNLGGRSRSGASADVDDSKREI